MRITGSNVGYRFDQPLLSIRKSSDLSGDSVAFETRAEGTEEPGPVVVVLDRADGESQRQELPICVESRGCK